MLFTMDARNITQVGAASSMFALKLGSLGRKAAGKIEQAGKSAAGLPLPEETRARLERASKDLADKVRERFPFPDELPAPTPTAPQPAAPGKPPWLLLAAAAVVLVLVLR